MYFKGAYDNRDKETGVWGWNPIKWFGKDKTGLIAGINTNTDFTSVNYYAGLYSPDFSPVLSYNPNYGIGVGDVTNTGSGTFYYPSYNPPSAETVANQFISDANNIEAAKRGDFDIEKAVDYLNSHAHNSSQGACSRYVQNALVAGGIKADNPIQAGRKYGPLLEKWGFNKVSATNYLTIKGDIAVIQGYPGGTADKNGIPYGHIQMYNGNQWVSDFFQTRPFWPGRQYELYKPSYEVFRW
jgi:hypothetical protein